MRKESLQIYDRIREINLIGMYCYNNHRIGNSDVGTAVGQAIAGFAHAGQLAVIGQMTCSDPNGETTVDYSITG